MKINKFIWSKFKNYDPKKVKIVCGFFSKMVKLGVISEDVVVDFLSKINYNKYIEKDVRCVISLFKNFLKEKGEIENYENYKNVI